MKTDKSKKFSDMTPEELFHCELDFKIGGCEEFLRLWQGEFMKDPMYKLEWSDQAFEHAAQLHVLKLLKLYLATDFEIGLKEFLERAHDEALKSAKWPSRSTSACTNHMKQCLGMAWAKAYEDYTKMKDRHLNKGAKP